MANIKSFQVSGYGSIFILLENGRIFETEMEQIGDKTHLNILREITIPDGLFN